MEAFRDASLPDLVYVEAVKGSLWTVYDDKSKPLLNATVNKSSNLNRRCGSNIVCDYVSFRANSAICGLPMDVLGDLSNGDLRLLRCHRYDLLSLGLVLLEIGPWERLEALWKPKYSAEPGVFVEKLLRAYVPRLRHLVGAVYCGVVERLLRTGKVEEGVDDGGGERDEEGKWAEVVARLVACRA